MEKENKKEETLDIDIGNEAINLVKGEWKAYDNALVFVTDRVAFQMRNLIKQLRKNYWGIFDNDKDPVTGQKMTWVPITEWICDTWVKASDRDSKDVKVRAKLGKVAYVGLTMLARNLLQNWMKKNVFGEFLDGVERQMAIDGSTITKVYKGYDEKGKAICIKTPVDLLNAYFDMTVDSILDTRVRFTERALMLPGDLGEMDGWINTKGITGSVNLHPTDTNLTGAKAQSGAANTIKMIDVWEMWGPIPKYLITGKKDDTKMVHGHIVVSGIQGNGENAKVHLVESTDGKKPYEEGHTKKLPGRWLSRGPAESVMMLQGWLNMIVNIRKIRASVSQLGIFKLRKNSGTSPQNVSRMAANGVIQVNNMDDIQQLVMEEASQSSYKDEEVAVGWAQRVTSTFEAVTGEPTPASKSATSIVMEGNATKTTFTMYKKAIGFYLEKLMNNHVLPMLNELLTFGEVVRISGSADELAQFDENIVNCLAKEQIARDLENGKKYDPEQVYAELDRVKKEMKMMGKDRFPMLEKLDMTDFEAEVYVGDEEFDAENAANNLVKILAVVPEYRNAIVKELFDLMGRDSSKIPENAPAPVAPANPGAPVNSAVPANVA